MIRKTLAATTLALTTLAALPAAADIITKKSPHSVPDTINRLETAVTKPVPRSLPAWTMPKGRPKWIWSCARPRC